MLLVFSVFGLGVGLAEALEMAVGDIVENDAAAERKKIPLALAQGGLGFFRQLGIHRDRNIRHGVAEQTFADPATARNRMVIHRIRVCDQPNRMSQNAQPFAGVHGGDRLQGVYGRWGWTIVEW